MPNLVKSRDAHLSDTSSGTKRKRSHSESSECAKRVSQASPPLNTTSPRSSQPGDNVTHYSLRHESSYTSPPTSPRLEQWNRAFTPSPCKPDALPNPRSHLPLPVMTKTSPLSVTEPDETKAEKAKLPFDSICQNGKDSTDLDNTAKALCSFDYQSLPSAPVFAIEVYDPGFGRKVRLAYKVSMFDQTIRIKQYGHAIAEEYREGHTPEEVRDAYQEKMRILNEEMLARDLASESEEEECDALQ